MDKITNDNKDCDGIEANNGEAISFLNPIVEVTSNSASVKSVVFSVEPSVNRMPSPSSSCWGTIGARLERIKGFLFAFVSAFFISLTGVLAKQAHLLSAWEQICILSSLLITVMLIVACSKRLSPLGDRKQLPFLLVRGLTSLSNTICLYISLTYIAPSDMIAITNSSLIVTAVLSRLLFGEKLSIAHMVATVLIIGGVLLIAKPSFLIHTSSSTTTPTSSIGIILAIMAAISLSLGLINTKKLCMMNTHWSINAIYGSYFAFPVCFTVGLIMWNMGLIRPDGCDPLLLATHYMFSCLSALSGIVGYIMMTKAFACEDATKISIAKSTDVFFSSLLQFVILGVSMDVWSLSGSVAIFSGISIVLIFKLVDAKRNDSKKSDDTSSCFVKFLFTKF